MNHPVVAFTSRYGSTRRYAAALGDRLGTPAVELADLDSESGTTPGSAPDTAPDAGPVIVLAPVYATRILGRRRVIRALRSAPGRAALVVVGLSPADDPARVRLTSRLVAAVGRPVATFHLRGDFDPAHLRWFDRALIGALRRRLRSTPDELMARLLLPGHRLELVDESALGPVITWVHDASTLGP